MKKLYLLLPVFICALVLGLTSCDPADTRNSHGALMTDQSQIDNAVQYVSTFVKDKLVTRVSFVPKTDQSVELNAGYMRVYYYDDKGAETINVLLCPLFSGGEKPYVENSYPAGHQGMDSNEGVDFFDIDFSKVASYVNKGGAMIVAANDEYEQDLNFSGFTYFNMDFVNDAKNANYKFILESKDFETSTELQDDYYEFIFEVIDGELISEDGLGEYYDDEDLDVENEGTEDEADIVQNDQELEEQAAQGL